MAEFNMFIDLCRVNKKRTTLYELAWVVTNDKFHEMEANTVFFDTIKKPRGDIYPTGVFWKIIKTLLNSWPITCYHFLTQPKFNFIKKRFPIIANKGKIIRRLLNSEHHCYKHSANYLNVLCSTNVCTRMKRAMFCATKRIRQRKHILMKKASLNVAEQLELTNIIAKKQQKCDLLLKKLHSHTEPPSTQNPSPEESLVYKPTAKPVLLFGSVLDKLESIISPVEGGQSTQGRRSEKCPSVRAVF